MEINHFQKLWAWGLIRHQIDETFLFDVPIQDIQKYFKKLKKVFF